MKKGHYIYVCLAAIWLLITVAPIPEHLINQMELVKIAVMIMIVIVAFKNKKNK